MKHVVTVTIQSFENETEAQNFLNGEEFECLREETQTVTTDSKDTAFTIMSDALKKLSSTEDQPSGWIAV